MFGIMPFSSKGNALCVMHYKKGTCSFTDEVKGLDHKDP